MDMKVENGKLSEYRTRVMLSFNYESGVGPAVTGRDIIGGFQCGEQILGTPPLTLFTFGVLRRGRPSTT